MLLVGLSSYGQELVGFNDEMDNKKTWMLDGSPIYLGGDRVFVAFQLPESEDLKEVAIYNVLGKKVSTQNTNIVDLRFLPAGTYILRVSLVEGQSLICKIIKM